MKKIQYIIIAVPFICLTLISCTKYLDTKLPTNSVSTFSAYNNKGIIDGVMNQMYIDFAEVINPTSLVRYSESLADNSYQPNATGVLLNSQINNTIVTIPNYIVTWPLAYKGVYMANTLLEGLPYADAIGFTETNKKEYIAAAKTVRAFCYFQLVRCFGDVPLITSTDAIENGLKGRNSKAEVYALIEKDLKEAIADLPATIGVKYFISNKFIPLAILANVYLTQGKWAEAESAATDIIASNVYQLSTVENAFLKKSTETILALGYTRVLTDLSLVGSSNSWLLWPEGTAKVSSERSYPVLSTDLLNSFETGDLRKTNWVKLSNAGNYTNAQNRMFCYKHKINIVYGVAPAAGQEEDDIIVRLAEIYLIRAEARANANNLTGAAADLNIVRKRAGLANTTYTAKADLVEAALKERRVELFFEQGHRWFDLIRTGKANTVLPALSYKTTNWKSHMVLFPLNEATLSGNPNLTQAPGY